MYAYDMRTRTIRPKDWLLLELHFLKTCPDTWACVLQLNRHCVVFVLLHSSRAFNVIPQGISLSSSLSARKALELSLFASCTLLVRRTPTSIGFVGKIICTIFNTKWILFSMKRKAKENDYRRIFAAFVYTRSYFLESFVIVTSLHLSFHMYVNKSS